MPQECTELIRLGRNVTEAVNAIDALTNRMDTENYLELIQARAAIRGAKMALEAHVEKHKCGGLSFRPEP